MIIIVLALLHVAFIRPLISMIVVISIRHAKLIRFIHSHGVI